MKKLMLGVCAGLMLFATTAEAKPDNKNKQHQKAWIQQHKLNKQQEKWQKEQYKAVRKQQKEMDKQYRHANKQGGYYDRYGVYQPTVYQQKQNTGTDNRWGDVTNRRSTRGW